MSLYPGRWRALLVPLCAPDCTCPTPGKSPHVAGKGWQAQALRRFDEYAESAAALLAAAMREHVRAGGNLGLALPPHVAALDVDTDLDGHDRYDGPLARDAILELCDGHPVQESGKTDASGRRVGVHVFGRVADRRPYGTHFGSVPVTIRGVGNQVAVAPSLHKSGLRYDWLSELPEDPARLPPFDTSWFMHVTTTRAPIERRRDESTALWRARVSAAWRAEIEDDTVVFDAGRRHQALLWAAWHAVTGGIDDASTLEMLRTLAATRCSSDGRFGAAQGTAEHRALERELVGIVRSCRRTFQARAARHVFGAPRSGSGKANFRPVNFPPGGSGKLNLGPRRT